MSAKGFDKNSLIGLVLIGAILLVFSYINQPSEEELKAKAEQERQARAKQEQLDKTETESTTKDTDTVSDNVVSNNDSTVTNSLDSIKQLETLVKYGGFAKSVSGEKKEYILENENIKVTLSNKGGRVSTVQLKEFQTYDSLPLFLFHEDSSRFNLELTTNDGLGGTRVVNTEKLFF